MFIQTLAPIFVQGITTIHKKQAMKIDHIGIWVEDVDKMRQFYLTYFNTTSGEKYFNPQKKFTSYFITFNESGCRIELMHRPDVADNLSKRGFKMGIAHLTISVGSKETVNSLTERFRKDGYVIEGEPRTSGDGYYESVVLDPEGNYIEILA